MRLYVLFTIAVATWPLTARAATDGGTTDGGTAAPAKPAPAPLPETPALRAHDAALRAQILEQVQADTDAKIKKAKDELRDEMRAEMATSAATAPQEFEQIPVQKPHLQLLELDGYFRLRPNMFEDLWLGWQAPDPRGYYLFPKPYVNTNGKTILSTDTRFRVEPTLNVSEDIKVKSQIDVFDNLVLGSTPAGGWGDLAAGQVYIPGTGPGASGVGPTTPFSDSQVPPNSVPGLYPNSIVAKRAWAEIMTPIGQLRIGRMGNHWGLGMFYNDGNCLDCDYGNTVDRIMFVGNIAGFYIIPMIDFVTAGPLYNLYANDPLGQPVAVDRALGSYSYSIVVARKDTDAELHKLLDEGKSSVNYGLYFTYRNQDHDALGYGDSLAQQQAYNTSCAGVSAGQPCFYPPNTPGANGGTPVPANMIDATNANFFVPDAWFRWQSKRARVEAEAVYVNGTFNYTDPASVTHPIYVSQLGGAVQTEYHFLSDGSLTVGIEGGAASPGQEPGFGNHPDRGSVGASNPTGSIDGPQFYCASGAGTCVNNAVTNFTFNRDYHVDMILWREILGGVTSAWYGKPSVRYNLTEGLDLSLALIYSQAFNAMNTPGGHLPLGLEGDAGIHYQTDDGFVANLDYGLLGPFGGLGEVVPGAIGGFVNPSVAQAIRVLLGVRF